MAIGLNKVALIGNVGREPEFRHTGDNKEIAVFTLATAESWRDKTTGERRERTEWHKIVIFNEGIVGIVKNFVHKGSKLYLEGNLHTRKYVDQQNQERYTTEIVLQNQSAQLLLLDQKNTGADSGSTNATPGATNTENLESEMPF